jgi:hypothetical protein
VVWYKERCCRVCCPLATPDRKSRTSINYPLGCCNPCKYPSGKWKEIAMNFVVGSPRPQSGYDSLRVVMDRLAKVAHFIQVKTIYTGSQLAELYVSRIVCLRGVPKRIVSNKGTQPISKFWERLHMTMDTRLNFSSAYNP